MRLALITALLCALAACGGQNDAAGPERGSAAGEVLGGEVTDAMLPLDSVKSTSPAEPRAAPPTGTATGQPAPERSIAPPGAEVSGGPEPHTPAPPGVDPADGPPPEQ